GGAHLRQVRARRSRGPSGRRRPRPRHRARHRRAARRARLGRAVADRRQRVQIHAAGGAATVAACRGGGMTTILVVEDEPEIRRYLRSSLGAEGFRVIESPTAERGAIDAGTHRPDLAIVVLALPDYDGRVRIREMRVWSPMPIVVLAALH